MMMCRKKNNKFEGIIRIHKAGKLHTFIKNYNKCEDKQTKKKHSSEMF